MQDFHLLLRVREIDDIVGATWQEGKNPRHLLQKYGAPREPSHYYTSGGGGGCYAMHTEATPLLTKFELAEDPDKSMFPKGVPWVRYRGKYKDLDINLVLPGKDPALGVDGVGTVSVSLVTYASIQAFKPDLVINAGTAGGFKAKGASIGDVYLASAVAFHDRRIPIPGAAVAYVTDLLLVPAMFVKAVTDIVDGEKPTAEEFLQNLVVVTAALDEAVTRVVDFISGKCISDL